MNPLPDLAEVGDAWEAANAPPADRPRWPTGQRLIEVFVGGFRRTRLEQRLFHTITLLNGVSNLLGVASLPHSHNFVRLAALQLGVGILFLLLYAVARLRGRYRGLYWPFVLLTVAFVTLNALGNAGTLGGAHYYFIPALVIAVMLSPRRGATIVALALFTTVTLAVLVVERERPAWLTPELTPRQRLVDVGGNFLFVQLFTALLVTVLAGNLNDERRKSDLLLLNILPEAVAEELKQTERVRPVEFESATVLFSDFVGFTRIAEGLTPQALVAELDRCFRRFDRIIGRRNLEKIKTIGDAYMAAGGVPEPSRTHAVDCVLAALEMQWSMEALRATAAGGGGGSPQWQVRVGVHSGDLVAGVIGWRKFAYDVWGDTVNTASRMESAGEPGRVNVSGATYERVRGFFLCEYRGRLPVKNKGEVDMYFVNRIRPELSADVAGRTPNTEFARRYRDLARGATSPLESCSPHDADPAPAAGANLVDNTRASG